MPDAEIVNLGIILHPDQRDAIKQALRLKLGSQLNIVSSDRDNLDVIRPDCSKAAALALLAERYKVPLSEVIVIGDSENDVGMFNIVKMSYCMADAEPQIQQKAVQTVRSVAAALELEMAKLQAEQGS